MVCATGVVHPPVRLGSILPTRPPHHQSFHPFRRCGPRLRSPAAPRRRGSRAVVEPKSGLDGSVTGTPPRKYLCILWLLLPFANCGHCAYISTVLSSRVRAILPFLRQFEPIVWLDSQHDMYAGVVVASTCLRHVGDRTPPAEQRGLIALDTFQ